VELGRPVVAPAVDVSCRTCRSSPPTRPGPPGRRIGVGRRHPDFLV